MIVPGHLGKLGSTTTRPLGRSNDGTPAQARPRCGAQFSGPVPCRIRRKRACRRCCRTHCYRSSLTWWPSNPPPTDWMCGAGDRVTLGSSLLATSSDAWISETRCRAHPEENPTSPSKMSGRTTTPLRSLGRSELSRLSNGVAVGGYTAIVLVNEHDRCPALLGALPEAGTVVLGRWPTVLDGFLAVGTLVASAAVLFACTRHDGLPLSPREVLPPETITACVNGPADHAYRPSRPVATKAESPTGH
jgi:hypothetical protein